LGPRLKLKWPNDLICDGAKLAGILMEGEISAGVAGGNDLAVVIGIGVNCAHHPTDTTYPATDLAEAGALVMPEHLFSVLSRTMVTRLDEWDRGNGFAGIRAAWLARAAGIGEPIKVALMEGMSEGKFETVDEDGRLVLRVADGQIQLVAAGDVFPIASMKQSGSAKGSREG
ncbi:MAG TPA: biotin--[acetyl-CoA-carboxylase] ligase, partial [Xanthobacteraceae bacterium]|nr:biotin--[acetyl-CoA-carboxylase] ligase [Xanthobacteraceae bacterium]